MTEGSQAGQPENRGSPEPVSYEAEVAAINDLFRMKLNGLRRRLRPSEIPAAVRVLQAEKQAALNAVKDRRATDRRAERLRRRMAKTSDHPRPS